MFYVSVFFENFFRNMLEMFSKENTSSVFTSKYNQAIFLYSFNIFSHSFSSLSRVTGLIYQVKFYQIRVSCNGSRLEKKRKKYLCSIERILTFVFTFFSFFISNMTCCYFNLWRRILEFYYLLPEKL